MMRICSVGLMVAVIAGSGMCEPVPTTINDFFLPGSQPNQSGNLEHLSKCDNCHGGYDTVVEPAFNWRGSKMSQTARYPLHYASVTDANQDATESGDSNGDGDINVGDAVYLINYIFKGGPAPAESCCP